MRSLNHIYHGEYELLNGINCDGGEWNIFNNCVDYLGGVGSEVLNKVADSTVD